MQGCVICRREQPHEIMATLSIFVGVVLLVTSGKGLIAHCVCQSWGRGRGEEEKASVL